MLLMSLQLSANHEGKNIDPIKQTLKPRECVCVRARVHVRVQTVSSKPLNPAALKSSFKDICCLKEPVELMSVRVCVHLVGRIGIL